MKLKLQGLIRMHACLKLRFILNLSFSLFRTVFTKEPFICFYHAGWISATLKNTSLATISPSVSKTLVLSRTTSALLWHSHSGPLFVSETDWLISPRHGPLNFSLHTADLIGRLSETCCMSPIVRKGLERSLFRSDSFAAE